MQAGIFISACVVITVGRLVALEYVTAWQQNHTME